MEKKIAQLLARLVEIEQALAHPEAFEDQKTYREMTQQHAYLSEIKDIWEKLEGKKKSLEENRQLFKKEKEQEIIELIEEEIIRLETECLEEKKRLETLLIPPDPNDNRNVIIELRAGTGGDEAALFVGDCVRMYLLYADKRGWKCELLSCNPAEVGGFKEYIMIMSGRNVNRFMQYEGGTHRVQRVPQTETQGRVHTSAITVAVLLEPTEEEEIELEEKDLRIDTYRASGAGGQHVNVTDSAVRITHTPTGAVAYCQQERSQHKNKDKALRLLKVKIVEVERQKSKAEEASKRAAQVGTGDRSERIRTYNFPQNRITDHRINLTLFDLDQVVEGNLEKISDALVSYFKQQKLQ